MLQQILHTMYVDPEILAELDDNQKQTLFCKMREEQVRRWSAWNDKSPDEPSPHQLRKRDPPKQVSFRKGKDGEPWVWVMGEHENDKTIEDIMRLEAAEEARQLAEKETAKMREEFRMNAQLISDYVDLSPKIEELPLPALRIEDDMDIYCSVEEIQTKIQQSKPRIIDNYTLNHYPTKNKLGFNDKGNQQVKNITQNVAQRVALWEKKFLSDKTCEIFQKIQRKQQQVAQEAEEEEKKKEQFWKEQEKKAKEAEQQMRQIARRAREEHKLNSCHSDSSCNTSIIGEVPSGKNDVLEWYRTEEKGRLAGLDSDENAMPWFHGLITRQEAEKVLLDQSCGSFLVRLSEKIWGYAISYRAKEKCKHYLVSAVPKYSFLGNNQIEHDTLGEMISFHRKQPLTGGETLEHPCPRGSSETIEELLQCN